MQPPPSAESERRRDHRFPLRVKVHLEFQDLRCLLSGFALSMSPSGMFIECEDPKPVGSRFEVEFRLGEAEEWIRGEGRVVWVQPATEGIPKGMGLRFHWIDPEGLQRVADLAANHARGGDLGLFERLAALGEEDDAGLGSRSSSSPDHDELDDTVSLPSEVGADAPTVELPRAPEPEVRGPLEDTVVTLGPDVMELSEAQDEPGESPARGRPIGLILSLGFVALVLAASAVLIGRGAGVTVSPPVVATPPAAERLAAEVEARPSTAGAFTHVEAIEWSQQGADTVVRIQLDGELLAERIVRVRMDDGAPREVIKLLAAERPFELVDQRVDSPTLLQIRAGFHQLDSGNEQHIVLDLASSACQVLPEEADGHVLQFRVITAESSSS